MAKYFAKYPEKSKEKYQRAKANKLKREAEEADGVERKRYESMDEKAMKWLRERGFRE